MVDDAEQLDLIAVGRPPARRCGCASTSTRRCGSAGCTSGVRRSPVRTPADAAALARAAAGDAGCGSSGVMFYEAQIAGLPDTLARRVRLVKRRSAAELARAGAARWSRRSRRSVGALEFVNSGGTGSLEVSSADPAVTEVTAGSGLYVPDAVRRLPRVRAAARRCTSRCRWCAARRRASRRCSAAATSPPGRPAGPAAAAGLRPG